MRIFNTLSRKKEEFIPVEPKHYRIYVCGPTVYNFIHIGNARPLIVYDVLRRYLEYTGNRVDHVMNITDIDDKLIKKAQEEGTTVKELASRYEAEFIIDRRGLNCLDPTHAPRATEHIDQMIEMINTLLEKGFAYESDGDVYFRTKAFEQYGKLCHMPMEELVEGARVNPGERKEEATDFALWKGVKPGEPSYSAPFGDGRPGWHIECSAMAKQYLGETFDLHGGGVDLVFPHHENEIAQSECANGKPFANYFMHNGFLNMGGNKMSKSLGNFFTTREVAERHGYSAIRFLMLSAHYRSPLQFGDDVVQQSIAALERIENCISMLTREQQHAPKDGENLGEACGAARRDFCKAMDDDLNTADALSVIFELIKETNSHRENLSGDAMAEVLATIMELCDVLGIFFDKEETPKEVIDLVGQRAEAKKAKDFALADEIREKITRLGYTVEDTRNGPVAKKI